VLLLPLPSPPSLLFRVTVVLVPPIILQPAVTRIISNQYLSASLLRPATERLLRSWFYIDVNLVQLHLSSL
jgi:hypothetical protein